MSFLDKQYREDVKAVKHYICCNEIFYSKVEYKRHVKNKHDSRPKDVFNI